MGLPVRANGRDATEPLAAQIPVPPRGIFYRVGQGELVITRVLDTRRRREPW